MLPEAITSVNDQTYENIELIVVDDCSPEPVKPVVAEREFDSTDDIRVMWDEQNRGANAARNTGITETNDKTIAFLDDGWWKDEKLEA